MKRILSLILCLCLVALPFPPIVQRAEADGIYVPVASGTSTLANTKIATVAAGALLDLVDSSNNIDPATLVASGNIAANLALIDSTTANAFIGGGPNFTPYQTGYYKVRLKNTVGGGTAIAWISATAPSGEALSGVELITNGDFSSDEPPGTAWDRHGLAWIITGGVAVSGSDADFNWLRQQPATVVGTLLKATVDIVRTSGFVELRVNNVITQTISSANTYSGYSTVDVSENNQGLYAPYSVFVGTANNFSLQRLTMPASTGALLLSSYGGSRGFIRLDSAFNPNAAMTYEVFDARPLSYHKGHLIKLTANGKSVQGFIGAAGGETLDATNIVTEWTNVSYDSFTSVSSPDIAAAVYTTSGTQAATSNATVTTVGKLYKLIATWTNVAGQAPTLSGTNGFPTTTLSTGANNIYFTATGTSVTLTVTNTAAASWGCTFVLKQVTDVATTGAKAYSTKAAAGLATAASQSWATNEGIDPNYASGFSYQIFKVLDAPVVAGPTAVLNADATIVLTAGSAAWSAVGIDDSAFLTGQHIIHVTDAAGVVAFGYYKSAGAGAVVNTNGGATQNWIYTGTGFSTAGNFSRKVLYVGP
jgi:hypothetical protein